MQLKIENENVSSKTEISEEELEKIEKILKLRAEWTKNNQNYFFCFKNS